MTEWLQADEVGIARAAALLRRGALVAFGTETVYGLGADATNDRAVAGIFAAKERPRFNPLICHYPDVGAAFRDVVANVTAHRLAEKLWPGPFTLVLPRRRNSAVSFLASAGRDTLAVRVPAHPAALALLRATGSPVAAPSANRSGKVSPSRPEHVLEDLSDRIAAVIDCGPCPVGVESTVLDLCAADPVLLRPGGATLEEIEAIIGRVRLHVAAPYVLRSPGMLPSHYAPTLPVRLGASDVRSDEALLAFGLPLAGAGAVVNLSDTGDLRAAAAGFFAALRKLDQQAAAVGLVRIAVMPIPDEGLGRAINDRLQRASAPRG